MGCFRKFTLVKTKREVVLTNSQSTSHVLPEEVVVWAHTIWAEAPPLPQAQTKKNEESPFRLPRHWEGVAGRGN